MFNIWGRFFIISGRNYSSRHRYRYSIRISSIYFFSKCWNSLCVLIIFCCLYWSIDDHHSGLAISTACCTFSFPSISLAVVCTGRTHPTTAGSNCLTIPKYYCCFMQTTLPFHPSPLHGKVPTLFSNVTITCRVERSPVLFAQPSKSG